MAMVGLMDTASPGEEEHLGVSLGGELLIVRTKFRSRRIPLGEEQWNTIW